jgi:hypothetical protein
MHPRWPSRTRTLFIDTGRKVDRVRKVLNDADERPFRCADNSAEIDIENVR